MLKEKLLPLQKYKTMKTRLQHFTENLSQDEFNLAFDYTIKNYLIYTNPFDMEYKTFRDALRGSFDFGTTKEGYQFWIDILERQYKIDLNSKHYGVQKEEEKEIEEEDEELSYEGALLFIERLTDKLMSFNEIIGMAEGYLDSIIENPQHAEKLAQIALEVMNIKYKQTMKDDKGDN